MPPASDPETGQLPVTSAHNRIDRILRWFSRTFGSGSEAGADIRKIVDQTGRYHLWLFLVSGLVLIALISAGWIKEAGINVLIWALVGAMASATAGAALGVLFGLPTTESKRDVIVSSQATSAPPTSTTGPNATSGQSTSPESVPSTTVGSTSPSITEPPSGWLEIGYRDSTSLEQIADWLTKIIVGLTLTQYASWEERFSQLSASLTGAMIGSDARGENCKLLIDGLKGAELTAALSMPACQHSAIPGGVIIAFFAITGFLISYLWMRRYFILEMVFARKQAEALLLAKSAVIREKAVGETELTRARTEVRLREVEAEQKAAEQQKAIEAAREAELVESSRSRSAIGNPEINAIFERAMERLAEGSSARAALLRIQKRMANESVDPSDPWRGMFGERPFAEGVLLAASVSPIENNPYFFEIKLCAHAETEKRKAELVGTKVLYFVHPTFGTHPKISSFGSDGTAPLELFAYGAFTVGALLEDGTTLELNLAALEGAPARFLAQ